MSDWTAGYVADIGYTFGYYNELNPLRIKLAFLHQGLVFPTVGAACELGFGQGLSTNIHAAASVVQWHGTDFNPSQAGFAQALSAQSGANVQLYDDAFADFAERPDLPDFDYIALHGIWSWISDANRQVIVDFVRRKLKVGGVLYISYNTLPGWASFAPMRHLLTEHADMLAAKGEGMVSRVDGALAFAEQLLDTNPLFSRANPLVAERLKQMKTQNRHYLAHEYFNRDWLPMHFATMAQWLSSAKLQYACSANYLDHIDSINLTSEQQTLLRQIPDATFRETSRDFMVNQQFRKDYWVKGARQLNALAQIEQFRQLRVLLVTPRADIKLTAKGALGEASMNEAVYAPILDALANHAVVTFAQLEQALTGRVTFAQLREAVVLLSGLGHVAVVHDDASIAKAKPQTSKLNLHLCQLARASNDISYLASPVTGGGVMLNRFQQLFVLAWANGHQQPADWAKLAWQVLAAQGQALMKDGKALASAADNLAELTAQAENFAKTHWPILQALQVV